jgi:formamidopyrimidine-DNA glycosylase
MPELPEVETTCRGIAPYATGNIVADVIIRNRRLRWPVPRGLRKTLVNQRIEAVARRAKYLLFRFPHGTLILHLGMSGSLRVVTGGEPPENYDHFEIEFQSGAKLRFRDPRRFGCVLWTTHDPLRHELLADLGPEPFSDAFDGTYLYQKSRGRKQAVKTFLMDSRIVAGIGNIYASEALYYGGIRPQRPAGKLTREQCMKLAWAIREVLQKSISAGGTTIRDYATGAGQPGYFALELKVYDRAGQPCERCGQPVKQSRLGQRSTYYCVRCQR